MEAHQDELERLQNLVVSFESRLEQLEERLSVMEKAVGAPTEDSEDEIVDEKDDDTDDTGGFLEDEDDGGDETEHSWQ